MNRNLTIMGVALRDGTCEINFRGADGTCRMTVASRRVLVHLAAEQYGMLSADVESCREPELDADIAEGLEGTTWDTVDELQPGTWKYLGSPDEANDRDANHDGNDPDGVAESAGARGEVEALIQIVRDSQAEMWHDDHGARFASLVVNGVLEHFMLSASRIRTWLAGEAYRRGEPAPTNAALDRAVRVLAADATWAAPKYESHIRVARGDDGAIYVDLADDLRQCVRIDSTGWSVGAEASVRFVRPEGMEPLPLPEAGGSWDLLWDLLNLPRGFEERKAAQVKVYTWLMSAYHPGYPHPVLAVVGEGGTGKSTMLTILKDLVDPDATGLLGEIGASRDVAILAQLRHVLGYDNLSRLTPKQSDLVCLLSTGGGHATRSLYTNTEEQSFSFRRPVLLGSIASVVSRSDLLSRTERINLVPILSSARRTEEEMKGAVQTATPRILACIFDAVSAALRNGETMELTHLPRMADAARWAAAGVSAWAGSGLEPLDVISYLVGAQHDELVEATLLDPLGIAIRDLASMEGSWKGPCHNLLSAVANCADAGTRRSLPTTPRAMRARLDELTPGLRAMGMDVESGKDRNGRWVAIYQHTTPMAVACALIEKYGREASVSGDSESCRGIDLLLSVTPDDPLFTTRGPITGARSAVGGDGARLLHLQIGRATLVVLEEAVDDALWGL